jgi:hypothetical protein
MCAGHIVALGNGFSGHCLELHEDDRFASHSLQIDNGLSVLTNTTPGPNGLYCFETSAIRETSIPGA